MENDSIGEFCWSTSLSRMIMKWIDSGLGHIESVIAIATLKF